MPQSLSSIFGKTLTSSSGINTVANIVTPSATFGDTAILPQNNNVIQVIGNAHISGNLGIGTTATVKLDVVGNVRVSGSVGIGTTNPTSKLHVVGDVSVSGVVTAFDFYNNAEYPSVCPTLDLAFAQTKILDSRITFTRASTATYVNASGLIASAAVNKARFDHDPYTGESLGLLVEESRTNIRTYSILFGTGVSAPLYTNWNSASILSNTAAIAPDGTLTANRFRPTSPTATLMQRFSATAGVTYTISMYLKLDTESPSNANIERFGFEVAWSNDGSTLTDAAPSPSIGNQLTNEWKRFSFSYTLPAGAISMEMGPSNRGNGDGDPNYSVLAWGWQIEQGAFPTSYIPTAGSTVTRSADVASITGTNFSDFYRQDEGTFIGEWFTNGSVNTQPFLLEASDSGRNIILYMIRDSAGTGRVGQSGATVGGDFDFQNLGALANNQKAKLGLAYKKNDAAGIMNGGTVSTDNQTGTITPDRLGIGNLGNVSSNHQPNGCIKRITYYPKRLPNAQLITLTL